MDRLTFTPRCLGDCAQRLPRLVKKKRQIDINHTQEGIGHGHKPEGRARANRRRDKKAERVA
jgi:hypothetical protein